MREFELKVYEGRHPRINVSEEFIIRNNFTLNRTDEEMIEYANRHDIFMSFTTEILVNYITPSKTVHWIKEDFREQHLAKELKNIDIYETTQDFLDYMVFGWMKALDERGISASRTVDKCGCYLWLLGRDDLDHMIRDHSLYNPYGSPALIKVCEQLQIYVPEDFIEFSKHKCVR